MWFFILVFGPFHQIFLIHLVSKQTKNRQYMTANNLMPEAAA